MENNNTPFGTPQDNNNATTELLPDAAASQTPSAADVSTAAPQAAPQQPYTYQPAQPVQTAAPQQPYNPYQAAQPVQTAAAQQSYNPYQAAYQPSVTTTVKRSVGKIISLIIGIILMVLGGLWLFATIAVFVSEYNTYGEVEISIPVVVIFSLPFIIGVILTVFGAKKKKVTAVPIATTNYYTAPQPTPYNGTATASPTAASTATAPTYTAAPLPNAPAADSTAPTVQPATETSVPTFNQAGQTDAQNPVSTAQTYQYAPTATIQDDSKKLAKKNARKNGLMSIGIVVLMWAILLITDYIFWYLLIIPIVISFNALKNNIKSIVAWLSMILSILSVILFVLLLIA